MKPFSKNHLALGRLFFPRGGGGLLKLLCFVLVALSCVSFISAAPAATAALEERKRDAAGLAWGPVSIGPFTMAVTNPHMGPVKPKYPDPVMHINVRVWEKVKNKNVDVANLHVVPTVEDGKRCWYVYESVTKTVVLDNCWDDWPEAFAQATETLNNFLTNLFKDVNLLEAAVIGALIAALGPLLDALAAAAVVA
jgi:hypothetical protein